MSQRRLRDQRWSLLRKRHRRGHAFDAFVLIGILSVVSTFEVGIIASPAGAASAASSSSAQSLTSRVYTFVSDSSGGKPLASSEIDLGFEPADVAYLYAADTGAGAAAPLAYHGTWSYKSGKLSLDFSAQGFTKIATFSLQLSAASPTMPFQVLSNNKGISHWRTVMLTPTQGIELSYAAALADLAKPASESAAVDVAYQYARSWIGHPYASASPASKSHISHHTVCPPPGEILITSVTLLLDAIQLRSPCALPLEVLLQARLTGSGGTLVPSSATSDPRWYLDPAPPHNPISDPSTKVALIISPFTYMGKSSDPKVAFAHAGDITTIAALKSVRSILQKDGYQVPPPLINAQATINGVARLFLHYKDPGVVVIETHGDSDGSLAFANPAPPKSAPCTGKLKMPAQLNSWAAGAESQSCVSIPESTTIMVKTTYIDRWAVDPSFFTALRSAGVNLEHSLVYIDGCATDESVVGPIRYFQSAPVPQSPSILAQDIRAGAYFAWNRNVSAVMGMAVLEYLAEALVRPTHTAEETYYNMLRVAKTGQMIYHEDALLNRHILKAGPATIGRLNDLYDELDGFGWNGTSEISYWGNGWLGGGSDMAGQIFYLLFSARWSHDITIGVNNLMACEKYWSAGLLPGLKDLFCQNANAGAPPTDAEVKYARYLLTGQSGVTDAVPRWTLNDGK